MTSSPGVNPRWFAPELLQQTAPVSTHSDVWSFAMVCLELMTGEPPFSNFRRDISVLRELDKGRTPDRPGSRKAAQGFTDELWSLMKKCWNKKPDSRPSMSTIKEKLWEMRGIPPPGPMSPQSKRIPLRFDNETTELLTTRHTIHPIFKAPSIDILCWPTFN